MNTDLSGFLSQLGLTEYEAKTLSTLFALKEAESPEVARSAQVPKTRVYDVLDKLAERELVIKIFSRPKKYRSLSPQEVFAKLIQHKKGELSQLEKDAGELSQKLEEGSDNVGTNAEERVLKVKSRTDFYKILAQEIDSAEKNVVGLSAMDVHHHLLHDSLRKAVERNVTVQLAGEHPPSFKEAVSRMDNGKVQLRDAQHGMHAYVIDGKKVIMMLSDLKKDKPEYHFAVWPHNPALADTFRARFDQAWEG